jgi:hypothetical protein
MDPKAVIFHGRSRRRRRSSTTEALIDGVIDLRAPDVEGEIVGVRR